jgi:hypothetical protein
VQGVAAVVARWYGGVNIGKARFRHVRCLSSPACMASAAAACCATLLGQPCSVLTPALRACTHACLLPSQVQERCTTLLRALQLQDCVLTGATNWSQAGTGHVLCRSTGDTAGRRDARHGRASGGSGGASSMAVASGGGGATQASEDLQRRRRALAAAAAAERRLLHATASEPRPCPSLEPQVPSSASSSSSSSSSSFSVLPAAATATTAATEPTVNDGRATQPHVDDATVPTGSSVAATAERGVEIIELLSSSDEDHR